MAGSSTKHVLHIIHGLTIGGAEIDLLHKCQYLCQHYNYAMTIVCLLRRGELAPRFEALGIEVIGPIMQQRYDLTAGWRLRTLLAEQQWDMIHTHLCAANLIGWLVNHTLLQQRKPMVAAEHAMAERWSSWVLWLDRLMTQSGVTMLIPSHASAASYSKHGIAQTALQVVVNGVDVQRFQAVNAAALRCQMRQAIGATENEFVVGTICRLEPVKNLPAFLQVVAKLAVKTIVVGEGSQHAELAQLIATHNWQDRISLVGRQTNIPAWLAAFDLFVLPSSSESFGLVVAEALLMEKPVVATRVGGIPEITDFGGYATLVQPDDPDELATAIRWTMANYSEATKMAQLGRQNVEKQYSVAAGAEQLHELYQSLPIVDHSALKRG